MLRLAALIAGLAWSTAAWAEGGDPTSLASWADLLEKHGGWGAAVIVGAAYWLANREKRDLNNQLVAAAGRTEKTAADITAALKGVEDAQETTGRVNAERWDSVKSMSSDIGRVANGVANNADAIRDVKAGQADIIRALDQRLGELRIDVQGALREMRDRDAAREKAEMEKARAEAALRDARERRP